jgi:DNA-binding IclR family transcriptional regulator
MRNPVTTSQKTAPSYAINSVDNALRVATMLQLEGELTVAEIAERIGVARSTAHRLLAMLVYRDFATQTDNRAYRAGPVLDLVEHSPTKASTLRWVALPHLRRLSDCLEETVNLTIRSGNTARFLATVEGRDPTRVGSREGMVFPAHRTTGGLLLLAELSDAELTSTYAPERYHERVYERPDMAKLQRELASIRRMGFALNVERSERGLVAVGVPVRDAARHAVAGLSVSMVSNRYVETDLRSIVGTLRAAARGLEAAMHTSDPVSPRVRTVQRSA